MTLDELKAEAKSMGYRLIKDNPKPKLLKCTCGRKNFSKWTRPKEDGVSFEWNIECRECGKASGWADSERKAIEKWNEMIESKVKNG